MSSVNGWQLCRKPQIIKLLWHWNTQAQYCNFMFLLDAWLRQGMHKQRGRQKARFSKAPRTVYQWKLRCLMGTIPFHIDSIISPINYVYRATSTCKNACNNNRSGSSVRATAMQLDIFFLWKILSLKIFSQILPWLKKLASSHLSQKFILL